MARNPMRFLMPVLSLAVSPALAVGAMASEPPPKGGLGAENIPIEFATENGWVYDGRIEMPPEDARNGYAVMMLGGGIGSPIDWAVPGVMTLDGKPTRDGDTIAQALLEAGFAVMRWHSIRRGDPKYAEDPVMMDPPPYPQTIEQTKKAYAAFREKKVVPDDRIFLLGHSLGARRAAILIDENPKTPGVVMLAGASLLPSDLDAAKEVLSQAEQMRVASQRSAVADGSERAHRISTASGSERAQGISTASGSERAENAKSSDSGATPQPMPKSNAPAADAVAVKSEERHERAVELLDERIEEWIKPFPREGDKYGYRWPAETLAERRTPTLLIVGSQDERWLMESYMFTVWLRRARHPDYAWKVHEEVGHQLGPEVPGPVEYKDMGVIANSRTGPIEPQVVKGVVDWLKARSKSR